MGAKKCRNSKDYLLFKRLNQGIHFYISSKERRKYFLDRGVFSGSYKEGIIFPESFYSMGR
jgi:hypothetical protein